MAGFFRYGCPILACETPVVLRPIRATGARPSGLIVPATIGRSLCTSAARQDHRSWRSKAQCRKSDYELPDDVDLGQVSIWCSCFRVNFGAAQMHAESAENNDEPNGDDPHEELYRSRARRCRSCERSGSPAGARTQTLYSDSPVNP